jgi:hypothetical protein
VCSNCGGGYYLSGNACLACSSACAAGSYQSAACSASADRVCSTCTATAIANCVAETCTTSSNQVCSSCVAGYYLSGNACVACSGACAAGSYQSAACSASADRVCSTCTAIANCTAETCTTSSNQVCSNCGGGYYSSGSSCLDNREWTRWLVPPAAPPAANYSATGGVVTDSVTGLEWQQTLSTLTYTWADAKTYCAGLSLGGTGWRPPTLVELESIVDYGRYNPAIDQTVFPSTPTNYFWSSSPYAYLTGNAWAVDFINGYASIGAVSLTYRVRCVR